MGFAHVLAGKIGFHALGLGFMNQKTIEIGNGAKIEQGRHCDDRFVQWDDGI